MNNKTYDDYFRESHCENREIKVIERDEKGNIIDVIDLPTETIMSLLHNVGRPYGTNLSSYELARKPIREMLNEEDKKLAENIMWAIYGVDNNFRCYTMLEIEVLEDYLEEYSRDEIEFALNFKNYMHHWCNYFVSMEENSRIQKMTFDDVLDFIRNTSGIYYARDAKKKGYCYLEEKPTKKQARYQRTKNGRKIVFLSFKDFKEYEVLESELK